MRWPPSPTRARPARPARARTARRRWNRLPTDVDLVGGRARARGRPPTAPRRPRCRPARRRSTTCRSRSRHATEVVRPDVERAGVAAELGEQECAGAERALGHAGLQAALGQQRGLLVDDQPGDRDRRRRRRLCCRRSRRSRRSRAALRRSARTAPSSSSSHATGVQIDQQRPAGGGGVGDERAAQSVHQPGVGGGDDAARSSMLRRIHAILGAEKYGSSTRPVRGGDRVR